MFLSTIASVFQHLRILIFTALVLLLVPAGVRAHPHIWVQYSVDVHFTDAGLAGFTQRWRFDEMFTNELICMYDLPTENPFTEEDVKTLRENAFRNLREYYYFTHVRIDGKTFDVRYVKGFNAWMDGRNMVYEFYVPCAQGRCTGSGQAKMLNLINLNTINNCFRRLFRTF